MSTGTNVVRIPDRPCSWKRAAKMLNLEVVDVQKLISVGQLKLVNTLVMDRAFEEFCRKHASAINMALIDPSTRKWLISEYGVPDPVEERKLPRAQKRALIVRACKCGRKDSRQCLFQARKAVLVCDPYVGETSRQSGSLSYPDLALSTPNDIQRT